MVEVVANCGRTEGDLLDHILAIDGKLKRHANIWVVEGGDINMHRQSDALRRRNIVDLNIRIPLKQGHRLVFNLADGVDIPTDKCGLTRVRVIDDRELHFVEIGPLTVPIFMTGQTRTDAGFIFIQPIRTAPITALPIRGSIRVTGYDRQVVVRHDPGKIGVR